MFDNNEPFKNFREELKKRGVEIHFLWSCKNRKTKYDNVFFVTFHGIDPKRGINTAVIVDYGGKNGFGLYIEALTNSITADADAIAGRMYEVKV